MAKKLTDSQFVIIASLIATSPFLLFFFSQFTPNAHLKRKAAIAEANRLHSVKQDAFILESSSWEFEGVILRMKEFPSKYTSKAFHMKILLKPTDTLSYNFSHPYFERVGKKQIVLVMQKVHFSGTHGINLGDTLEKKVGIDTVFVRFKNENRKDLPVKFSNIAFDDYDIREIPW